MHKDLESIQEARTLAEAASAAFREFERFDEDQVERILAEISKTAIENAAVLARLAHDETGYGTVEHKTLKNLFCGRDVYNAIRPMKTVGIVREDREKKVMEVAGPIGVVAAIIPSTNPTSTTIYKALIALKGRNTIVFSPHPAATRCILETSRLIAEAAERAGAPKGTISCMRTPTLAGTEELMKSPQTSLILATGGPGLVKAAYSAGKPAYGVGPGNVPTYIDRTADVPKAVRDILTGKTFDNGTLCSSEQSIVCDVAVRDAVLQELRKQKAHICNPAEKVLLEKAIQTPRGGLNTRIVGKSAAVIAKMAGISVPAGTRVIVAEGTGVGPAHPISIEKLSPILAFYTVKDWREGCERCIEILRYGGLGHTLSLHVRDESIVREFALRKPAYRICVNTPSALGAVGYTTNLFPAMTLGCGAPGNNITSDNISPLHLIHIKRVAYGVREADTGAVAAPAVAAAVARTPGRRNVRSVIESVVNQFADGKRPVVHSCGSGTPVVRDPENVSKESRKVVGGPFVPSAPRLSSYADLDPRPAAASVSKMEPVRAVPFVCEDDVRAAMLSNKKIAIGKKTIVTPSARDLADANDVFMVTE